ncbi:hypothetical protein [Streptomyces atroolivaceus]|uniref:hypothetical protein n=1 Tax=Streptomyces atroolivaceus TaxID=66869 RepID=UPI0037B39678
MLDELGANGELAWSSAIVDAASVRAKRVLLDTDTAGCVYTWINNDGAHDPGRRRILQTCVVDLERVIPQISDPSGRKYYQRLHQLALLISRSPDAR